MRHHGPAAFLLATPRYILRAHPGPPLAIRPGPGQFTRAALTAERALRHAGPGQCVVGALPFDESTPAVLAIGRLRSSARTTVAVAPAARTARPPIADPGYLAAVGEAIRRLRAGDAEKVVLARSLTLTGHVDPTTTLHRLHRNNPTAHVFHVDLEPGRQQQHRRILLGASAELLLARHGNHLLLNPLAGSAPRHHDPIRDRAQATALLNSTKDLREHRLLVDELRHRLTPICGLLEIPEQPLVEAGPRLWHLSTRIRAQLRPPAPNALTLAALLHPSPAVCGLPRTAARTLINRLETHPRGYYGGLIGWMDRHGDGRWVIALRCAEAGPHGIRLWAGAGILAESDPRTELARTGANLATMLDALTPVANRPRNARGAPLNHGAS
ncbi:isochorismate synthase [Embleya sp. AB8]|uniref:isochorismate synthase n=1 Tax=Embleya sp. AB8 TaxID=3156304 RepID=UPI003C742215